MWTDPHGQEQPLTINDFMVVDERNARFQAYRHARTINLGQNIVGQVGKQVHEHHPLDTVLKAAERLSHRSDLVFCFIGGGSEFRKVKNYAREKALNNIVCLPYQPIEKLAASLSAADLHLVVMGEPFVGIVHPCKIYNILVANRQFLYIGPRESSITDLISQLSVDHMAGHAAHGDVERTVAEIERSLNNARSDRSFASNTVAVLSQEVLVHRMMAAVTNTIRDRMPEGELQPAVSRVDKVA